MNVSSAQKVLDRHQVPSASRVLTLTSARLFTPGTMPTGPPPQSLCNAGKRGTDHLMWVFKGVFVLAFKEGMSDVQKFSTSLNKGIKSENRTSE